MYRVVHCTVSSGTFLPFGHSRPVLRIRIYNATDQNWHNFFAVPPIVTKLFSSRSCVILLRTSVPDPWHFGVDPDPRIHSSDKWMRIRILLFSSLTFKTPTKTNLNKVLLLSKVLFECTFASFFKDKKSKRSHKTVGIKVFRTIFAWWYW